MTDPPGFRAIVLGYDGSPASARGLALGVRLARAGGARLFLVHARERDVGRAEPTTEEESTSRDDAVAASVATWVRRAAEEGVAMTAVARDQAPPVAILAVAEEVGADLIVVGTRGLHPAARVVLGSVSSDVVARARRPVVVVP